MSGNLTPSEEAQLVQTIEMFEVIAQSAPNDHESLDILKEAYSKLGRVDEVVNTSKRIAKAHEATGQLSSAILEYESILDLRPDDPDVKNALSEIVNRANSFSGRGTASETELSSRPKAETPKSAKGAGGPAAGAAGPGASATLSAQLLSADGDDGKDRMREVFVDGKYMTPADFEKYWQKPDPSSNEVMPPFLQTLADNSIMTLDESLKLMCDKSRLCFLPVDRYDVDVDWLRSFPKETCRRWCILPLEQMSKSMLVATANPWNNQALEELKATKNLRVVWYLASPPELVKVIKKLFR